MLNIDTIGVPLLLTTFFIEFLITVIHQAKERVVKDMLANVLMGIFTIVTGAVMKGVALGFYSFFYSFAIFTPDLSWWLWIIGLFLCELIHYFYHRLGHKTRLFWAGHVAHHSSLHFNFSIGLRVNFLHLLYRFLFWTPLCLIGIPPEMILFFESLTAIWNFLIHAEKVKKLGVLDLFLNTPSNHRVHHASNPEYIDKNLGGITVIYDHLFKTYVKETSTPVYGITHNIDTHNPVKILTHEYKLIIKAISNFRGWGKKIHFLFSPPGEIRHEPGLYSQVRNNIGEISYSKSNFQNLSQASTNKQ